MLMRNIVASDLDTLIVSYEKFAYNSVLGPFIRDDMT